MGGMRSYAANRRFETCWKYYMCKLDAKLRINPHITSKLIVK